MREFDKIIGYDDVKTELMRICDIMINKEKYSKLGVGKTLMANCLIKASGRKYFYAGKISQMAHLLRK